MVVSLVLRVKQSVASRVSAAVHANHSGTRELQRRGRGSSRILLVAKQC